MDWRFFYIIGKLLRHKCLKWVCMIHLNTYNTNYSRKKCQKLKCKFDSRPLKVRNCPNLYVCRWHATYYWFFFTRAINFLPTSPQSEVFIKNYRPPKWWESQKWHLGATLVASHSKYYKGESDGFPQIQIMVSLVSPCMSMARSCTKNALIMH